MPPCSAATRRHTPCHTAANNLVAAVENIWTQETGLFQRPPFSDGAELCNGGNGKFDIYVTRESLAAWAQTVLYLPGAATGRPTSGSRPTAPTPPAAATHTPPNTMRRFMI